MYPTLSKFVLLRIIAPCLAIIALHACVETFVPETSDKLALLVVEGHISDSREHPYAITLSRSFQVNLDTIKPEKGAVVWVTDQAANTFRFSESTPGQYQSDPAAFTGQIGETYTLHIETADGQVYQSTPVLLKRTPPIDSVYYQLEQRITDQGDTKYGVSILLDSHDPEAQTGYYRFDWQADYAITVPYPSQWEYVPGVGSKLADFHQTCYNFEKSRAILITNSQSLNEDRTSGFELTYVNTDGYELRTYYSIVVRQYALDKAGYQFWQSLAKNSQELGSLFAPVPYQITGNVVNIQKPEEPVLGYFDASSVTEKRLSIARDALSELYYPPSECKVDTVRTPDELDLKLSWGYLVISPGSLTSPTTIAPRKCADCRVFGSPEKPGFWTGN